MILPISNNMQELEKGNMSMKQLLILVCGESILLIGGIQMCHSGTFDPFQWNTST